MDRRSSWPCDRPFSPRARHVAQQRRKVARIGVSSRVRAGTDAAFRQGLVSSAMSRARISVIEYRHAEGKASVFPSSRRSSSVLRWTSLCRGTVAPLAAKQAHYIYSNRPGGGWRPVGTGLVANLAKPGGNVTGLRQPF